MDACVCESLNCLSYGLYLVTSSDGTHNNGLVANTAFQVSADPAKVAVCICKQSFTHEIISKSNIYIKVFTLH